MNDQPTGYHQPIDLEAHRSRRIRAGAPAPDDYTLTDRSTESLVADALRGYGRIYTPEPHARPFFIGALALVILAGIAVYLYR